MIPALASNTNKLYSQKRKIWTAIKCAKAIWAAISWMHNTAETHTALCVPSHPITFSLSWEAQHPWIKGEQLLFFRKSIKIHEEGQFHFHISGSVRCKNRCVCPWAKISLISSICSASRQSSSTGDQGLYLKPTLACNILEQNAARIYQDYSNGPVNTQQSLFEWKFRRVMCTCSWPAHLGLTVIQDGFINSRSFCDSPTFTRAADQFIWMI